MRRRLQRLDQQLPGAGALQAVKLVGVDNNHGIAAMQRDVLRPITVRQANKFAESRLGVLKPPTAARRLCMGVCENRHFSSHADQISTATRLGQGERLESSEKSVPPAITCALQATDFVDAIRNAVSLGGDSDTQAAIAGSIAEARFGIPEGIARQAWQVLPADMRSVLSEAYRRLSACSN